VPPLAIGGAISAGGSILSGILGASAADKAAKQQAAAGQQASNLAGAAGTQAQAAQQSQLKSEGANEQPFVGAGQQAVGSLSNLLAPGGQLTQGYGSFTAPTGVTEQNDPGYQFRLQQGQNALQNSAAARGGLLSTGTAKNLNDYAQGAASQEYGNVYNRALGTYQTNQNNFNTNNSNLYSRLFGIAGLGQNAASSLNNVQQQGTNSLTGNLLATAQLQGSDITGIGNAQAAGTIGQANAIGGALSNGANAIGQGVTLSSLLGARNASNPGSVAPTNTNVTYDSSGQNSANLGNYS
jgi:hypothetical protein